MSIFEQIKNIGNNILSKIYGQKMQVGVVVAPQGEPIPTFPEIKVIPPKIEYGLGEAKTDLTPYLLIGGVVLVVLILAK